MPGFARSSFDTVRVPQWRLRSGRPRTAADVRIACSADIAYDEVGVACHVVLGSAVIRPAGV